MAAPEKVVNIDRAFGRFDDRWSPKIVAQINDLHLKVVKAEGEFVWHDHPDTDEFFLVRSGHLSIQLEGRPDVALGPGDLFVVPRGMRHRPVADGVCEVLLLEPAGVVNTGDAGGDLTAPGDEWI